MRTVVAGSRWDENNQEIHEKRSLFVWKTLDQHFPEITEVVSGTARGADRAGERWAYGQEIPVKAFPADWDQFGKRAGYLRNQQMAEYADQLIAFWDGSSKGTKHMIEIMEAKGKPVYIYGGE